MRTQECCLSTCCFYSRGSASASVNWFALTHVNLQSAVDLSLRFSSREIGFVPTAELK